MDKVHKGKRPKFNMYNFVDEIFIRGEECNAPVKKNKKMEVRFFGVPCAPPTPLSPTTHSHKYPSLSLAGYHSFTLFFFSHKHNKHSSLTLSSSPTGVPHSPPSPPSFFGKITRKSFRTSKHLHIFYLR